MKYEQNEFKKSNVFDLNFGPNTFSYLFGLNFEPNTFNFFGYFWLYFIPKEILVFLAEKGKGEFQKCKCSYQNNQFYIWLNQLTVKFRLTS